jgi:hypothetical protein
MVTWASLEGGFKIDGRIERVLPSVGFPKPSIDCQIVDALEGEG